MKVNAELPVVVGLFPVRDEPNRNEYCFLRSLGSILCP